MEGIKDGWFVESNSFWPGEAYCLQVEKVLFHKQSPFQDVLVFKSTDHGNVLALNGIIQCTERDEFAYQEMIAHLPLVSHPCPRKVLVIGGGDGGVVREVVKHPEVESVSMCEIDKTVVEASRKFLPHMSAGFESSKLTLHIGDGFEFMRDTRSTYDVIITDSSDPEGPAAALFQQEYFKMMRSVLNDGGIVCCQGFEVVQYGEGSLTSYTKMMYREERSQGWASYAVCCWGPFSYGEGMWLDLPLIVAMQRFSQDLYPVVDYGYSSVPTYASGVIGYCLCSKNPKTDFRRPLRVLDNKKFRLRYYNADVHSAAFALPQFLRRALHEEVSSEAKDGRHRTGEA